MEDVFCPFCGRKALVKKGTTKGGKQRYYCKFCETSFVDKRGEDLTEKELEHLKENLTVEVLYRWDHWDVDLKNSLERSLFSKLPEIPIREERCDTIEVFTTALAAELGIPVETLEEKVYRALVWMISTDVGG